MAKFLKIRYNANGFLKNRIINADDINLIEPFSGPAGRYVDETRSRIFMKDGTKYDMSTSVDEIQKILDAAGALIAEIHSTQPVRQVKAAPLPQAASVPVSLYKRSTLTGQKADASQKIETPIAKPIAVKPAPVPVAASVAVPAVVAPKVAVAKPAMPKPPTSQVPVLKPLEAARHRAEVALAKTMDTARKTAERVLIKHPEAQRNPAEAAGGRA